MRYFLLIILLYSCSAEKRLSRIIEKNPQLLTKDTIHDTTVVIVPEIRADTFISLDSLTDTVYISKDRLQIKTVIRNNEIFIEGKCLNDTITIIKEIPVDRIIIKELTWWQKNKWWVIPLLIGGAYLYARKKIPFLP